ncbi:MAG: carboxymuconolactone decarboxylase family protein [Neisseriaceae bacterium]|nr:carboxymuconolactone decarboxylase family protein [Neisseriaceae bacterium]MBP6861177.1 carboxymuconolactone decarboxylase family protein [Neisseriaceae bacterium]
MNNKSALSDYGIEIMNRLEAGLADKVIASLSALDPELPKLIVNYAFADVVGRPGLDLKTRELVTVASLISLGNAAPQLALHMRAALNIGVSQEALLEVVIQMAIYAGVPACMNGLTAYRQAIASTAA